MTARSSRNLTLIASVPKTASVPRAAAGSAALAQGCEAQFKLGYFHINQRVRQRHYPLVDTERGVVGATGFFDHDNAKDTYMTTDGKVQKTLLEFPNSLSLMEAFKIRNGKIYRVEAIFTYVPYYIIVVAQSLRTRTNARQGGARVLASLCIVAGFSYAATTARSDSRRKCLRRVGAYAHDQRSGPLGRW